LFEPLDAFLQVRYVFFQSFYMVGMEMLMLGGCWLHRSRADCGPFPRWPRCGSSK